jgi:hypothetical protein
MLRYDAPHMLSHRLLAGAPLALAAMLATTALGGCLVEEPGQQAASVSESSAMRPWEVVSEQGESYLPNLFYADAIQNEQVMPTAVDGRHLIDRMVYPTLGNPNLYVKDDDRDSLMVVLRIEPELLAHLGMSVGEADPDSGVRPVTLSDSEMDRLSFHLVSRAGRDGWLERDTPLPAFDQPELYRIVPSAIELQPQPSDLPASLARRTTLRIVFRADALARVPAALYDLRYDLVRSGALVVANGDSVTSEYQYNAVRIFEHVPNGGDYSVISVTDTQVSVGKKFSSRNQPQLRGFVSHVNNATRSEVADAAFITFNGDLHHGGSPVGLRHKFVATTYAKETSVIVEILRDLELPLFLTPGNHDGHSSMGHAPPPIQTFDKIFGNDLKKVVSSAHPKAWPNFDWDEYTLFHDATENQPDGWHLDLFNGAFSRRPATTFAQGWSEIPREDRNMVLYDGFNQWRRSYGPLHYSWGLGDNLYVSLNTFDLRQHRRSGWGMYTVNYGGGMSDTQLDWLERQLDDADAKERDVVLLGHHDPRGGHKGEDHSYYFSQVPYRGVWSSMGPYLLSKLLTKVVCKLPNWALTAGIEEDCEHEGLQEWMRPDAEFDCAPEDRLEDGMCDPALLALDDDDGRTLRFDSLDLMSTIARHQCVRTLMLGHTHAHSMEMLQSGDALIEIGQHGVDHMRLAALEIASPGREQAWASLQGVGDSRDIDPNAIVANSDHFYGLLAEAAADTPLTLQGQDRELLILRLTSNAAITWQRYLGMPMMGFTVIHMSRRDDARNYADRQMNALTYYLNDDDDSFERLDTIALDRTQRHGRQDADNPVFAKFD